MAHRQNSYARLARQQVREANQVRAEADAAARATRQKTATDHRVQQKQAEQEFAAAVFDVLRPGDSLECFGLAAVVAKKNGKSVVTTTGTRWTHRELTGAT